MSRSVAIPAHLRELEAVVALLAKNNQCHVHMTWAEITCVRALHIRFEEYKATYLQEDLANYTQLAQDLRRMRRAVIYRLRVHDELTFQELGDLFGVSADRTRVICARVAREERRAALKQSQE